ncbi:unnamed protein product [Caenorhabditis auriculariae]|uniref:Uncharacterized protein n=1 Tax=Caenorhabditis auriculariae TaxID=2777116 RepID=A0A8S1GW73_9PELO|nr:unnamed protein product [Caenorhabditis auriculariae]
MLIDMRKTVFWLFICIGVIFIIIGTFLLVGIPIDGLVDDQVVKRDWLGYTTDKNGSRVLNDITNSWLEPTYEMKLNIWMFNVTNVDDVVKRQAKPHLDEIGPFVFEEHQKKILNGFILNDTRVIYRNLRFYHFNRNASCPSCNLDSRFVIPNIVFQKLVDAADETIFGVPIRIAVESVLRLSKEGPFVTVTAREALFDGYHDQLVDLVCENKVLKFMCEIGVVQKKIGFFYGQNGTSVDGTFEVGTGQTEPRDIGHVFLWNNLTQMPNDTWDTPEARAINGSDGQLFAPLMKSRDRLYIFVPQICRTIQMEYAAPVEFDGVTGWRYNPPTDFYDPALPKNIGFCNKNGSPRFFANKTVQPDSCLPAGFIDLSRCQAGSPRVYLSQPHFYSSPNEVWQAVSGMAEPRKDKDETYLDIEPTAGVPIRANRLMQINVGMVKGSLAMTANMTNVIVPVLWINETAVFDPDTRSQLQALGTVRRFAFVGGISTLALGLLAWLGAVLGVVVRQRDYSELQSDHGEEPRVGHENFAVNAALAPSTEMNSGVDLDL